MSLKQAPGPDFVVRHHKTEAQCLCYHFSKPDIVYTGDSSGTLIVWDLLKRRPRGEQSLHLPEAGITSLHHIAGQPDTLLSQGRDGLLKVWELDEQDLPGRSPSKVLQTFSFNFCRCVVWQAEPHQAERYADGSASPQLLVAISGSNPADIELWDVQEGRLWRSLEQPEGAMKCGMCMSLAFLEPGDGDGGAVRVVGGYEDGSVAVWDAACGSSPLAVVKVQGEPVMAASVHGRDLFTASAEDSLSKLRWEPGDGGDTLSVARRVTLKAKGVSDIAVRKDGRVFATAGWDNKVRVFSCKSCAPLAVLQYHRGSVAAVAFCSSSNTLASASRDKTVAFWTLFS